MMHAEHVATTLPVGTAVWLTDDEYRDCRGIVSRAPRSQPEPPEEGMVYVRWSATCFSWEHRADLTGEGR
jgi:hypothetical protein